MISDGERVSVCLPCLVALHLIDCLFLTLPTSPSPFLSPFPFPLSLALSFLCHCRFQSQVLVYLLRLLRPRFLRRALVLAQESLRGHSP